MWFDDELDDDDYPFDADAERDAADPYWKEGDSQYNN